MVDIQELDVHVVIWDDVTAKSASEVVDILRLQYQRCGRQRLAYVGVVPENSPLPDPEARKALAQAMREVLEMCDYPCIILQGTGVKASAKRAAFAGILLMAMKGKWHVAGGIDELIGKTGGDLRRINQLKCAAKLAAERGWKL